MKDKNLKYGFTLAEVLITLVVIGIISAMTIPTLIAKHQKEETVSRLKKTYNELKQAITYASADEGDCTTWNYAQDAVPFFNQYLKRYIALNRRASSQINNEIVYKRMNGDRETTTTLVAPYSVTYMLADGSFLTISGTAQEAYKTVFIDINGYKGPNVIGRDVFQFSLQPIYGITPQGFGAAYTGHSFGYTYNRSLIKNSTPYGCNKRGYGEFCAALIVMDGWKISDDYPWN